jgi:tetratricopeptide (TPR) repeat protein
MSLVAGIMVAAAITHQLRDRREAELEQARTMAHKQRAYQGALDMLQKAERWPSTANPGRIDYLRAWTYEQLGDRRRAEECYVRSYRADPMYFWTVADLALFYSSSGGSREVRKGLARTYLEHLQKDFPGHPELVAVLTSAEEALARPGSVTPKDLQSLSDRQREE